MEESVIMKSSEIREMSVKDLRDRIATEQANLGQMRMNHAISPLEDSSKIRKAKKTKTKNNGCSGVMEYHRSGMYS